MLHRKEGGFDEDAALQDLIAKYGQEASAVESKAEEQSEEEREEVEEGKVETEEVEEVKVKKGRKKRKVESEDDEGQKKKVTVKKTEQIAVEENRPIAEAIQEMAKIYFQNKEMRTGGKHYYMPHCAFSFISSISCINACVGVFAKAAKALRECEHPIRTAKDALALKGIGKGIAGYVGEMLTTGSIQKLEQLRAGVA
jgi:hypothetical protein